MADQPNRIVSGNTTFATLPDRPRLTEFITSGVLKKDEAIKFDTATDRWWQQVQHIIKTQWLAE